MALRISGDGSLNLSDVTLNNVTASGLSASGNVVLPSTTEIGAVSSTELGYVDGVTSALQTQLNAKAELSAGYQYHSTIYYTSNGTFTKASYPWLRAIRVKCQGGGGGGGGCEATTATTVASSGGGGGGSYAESFITDIAGLSASVTVTVGAGGGGGAAGDFDGSAGSNSSFGTAVVGNGGDYGFGGRDRSQSSSYQDRPGDPMTVGTGDLVIPGGPGRRNGDNNNSVVFAGGSGDSFLGVGQDDVVVSSTSNGGNGHGYGSGGGPAVAHLNESAMAGGNGADGIVIVELYA